LEEDFPAVRFNLDSTYAGMSEKDSAEQTSSCPGEQVQLSEGSVRKWYIF
jgi:hypothetical protein